MVTQGQSGVLTALGGTTAQLHNSGGTTTQLDTNSGFRIKSGAFHLPRPLDLHRGDIRAPWIYLEPIDLHLLLLGSRISTNMGPGFEVRGLCKYS